MKDINNRAFLALRSEGNSDWVGSKIFITNGTSDIFYAGKISDTLEFEPKFIVEKPYKNSNGQDCAGKVMIGGELIAYQTFGYGFEKHGVNLLLDGNGEIINAKKLITPCRGMYCTRDDDTAGACRNKGEGNCRHLLKDYMNSLILWVHIAEDCIIDDKICE